MSWDSWRPTHLGYILWALPHGVKELPGSWEVEILEVAQGVRVSAWKLGRGNPLQEFSFKFGGHRAWFYQGDAGNRNRGRWGLVPQHIHGQILPTTVSLSFSSSSFCHFISSLPVPPSPPLLPFSCPPITASLSPSVSIFPSRPKCPPHKILNWSSWMARLSKNPSRANLEAA